jgi:hypothetical protein
MNWYKSKNIKIAGAKEKIQKYRIIDSAIIAFIHKYENLIDWNMIDSHLALTDKDAEFHINKAINSKPLTALFNKIRFGPESIALKGSNYYQVDPESEETIEINKEKLRVFQLWWDLMTHKWSNPAFAFLMLKPIFDSSGPNKKAPPPEVDAEVVNRTYKELIQNPQMNTFKIYMKDLKNATLRKKEFLDHIGFEESMTGWLRVKSKTNDPDHFEYNLEILKSLSRENNWCTARNVANSYLSEGDFWLYMVDGTAKVAIRLTGNNSVIEIRGKNNQIPKDYWEEVISFLHKSNFEYQHNISYKKLLETYGFNQDLREMDETGFVNLIDTIESKPLTYEKLSAENKKNFPVLLEAAIKGWTNPLALDIQNFRTTLKDKREKEKQNLPVDTRTLSRLDDYKSEVIYRYRRMPVDMRERLSDIIIEGIKDVYAYCLTVDDPSSICDVPKEIAAKISKKEWVNAIYRLFKDSGVYALEFHIPENVMNIVDSRKLRNIVLRLFLKDPTVWEHAQQQWIDMMGDQERKVIADELIKTQIEKTYSTTGTAPLIPEDLEQYIPFEKIVEAWTKFVRDYAVRYVEASIPEHIKSQIPIDEVVSGYKDMIKYNPGIYLQVPQKLQPMIDQGWLRRAVYRYFKINIFSIFRNQSVSALEMMEKFFPKEFIGKMYTHFFKKNPSSYNKIPDHYREYVPEDVLIDSFSETVLRHKDSLMKALEGDQNISNFVRYIKRDYRDIPDKVKEKVPKEVIELLHFAINSELAADPYSYKSLSAAHKEVITPETMERIKEYWRNSTSNITHAFTQCPLEVQKQLFEEKGQFYNDVVASSLRVVTMRPYIILQTSWMHEPLRGMIPPYVYEHLLKERLPDLGEALAKAFYEYRTYTEYYAKMPDIVRNAVPEKVKKDIIIPFYQRRYDAYGRNALIPKDIVPFIERVEPKASANHWYKYAQNLPNEIARLLLEAEKGYVAPERLQNVSSYFADEFTLRQAVSKGSQMAQMSQKYALSPKQQETIQQLMQAFLGKRQEMNENSDYHIEPETKENISEIPQEQPVE